MEVLETSGLSSRPEGRDQDAAKWRGSKFGSWDLESSGFMVGLAVGGYVCRYWGRQPVVLSRGIPCRAQEFRDMGKSSDSGKKE